MTIPSKLAVCGIAIPAVIAGWVSDAGAQSLGTALDNPTLAITQTTFNASTQQADPALEWFFQTAVAHDTVDAAQCSALPADSFSRIDVTVQGPATVSFWWRKDAANAGDEVTNRLGFFSTDRPFPFFHVSDGEWEQKTVTIDCGEQVVSWFFENRHPTEDADPANRAWLDQVVVTPLPNSPAVQAGLDNNTLQFFSEDWLNAAHDGASGARNGTVARSGPVEENESSTVTFDYDGALEISFDWGVEADPSALDSGLTFQADGQTFDTIFGTETLSSRSFEFGPGHHCFKFIFTRGEPYGQDDGSIPYEGGHEGFVDNLVISPIPPRLELKDAVDNSRDVYGKAWFRQTVESHDGVDAACVTGLDPGDEERLYVELPDEPGLLSFWYKLATEENAGFMDVWVDGSFIGNATGVTGWRKFEANLGEGADRVLWLFYSRTTRGTGDAGDNVLYIDQVRFQPGVTNYQPDLTVKAPRSRGGFKGNNRYNRSGAGQLVKYIPNLRRAIGKFKIRAQNDCPTDSDKMKFFGTRANRHYDILYVAKVNGQLINISAEFQTGQFSTETLEVLQSEGYEVWIFPKEGFRRRVQTARVRAVSESDPTKVDTIKCRMTLPRLRR